MSAEKEIKTVQLQTGTINKVFLVGYVMKEVNIVEQNGVKKGTFVMVTHRQWVNEQQELKTFVEWHRIVTYGKLAESLIERAKERCLVCVEGRIQTRMYEINGVTKFIKEIIVDGQSGKYQTLRRVRKSEEIIDKTKEYKVEDLNEEQREALLIDEINSMLLDDDDFKNI